MSSNPYIVVGKLQVRRGSEYQLPGRPISINPTRFSETLDSGEFGLTTDTQRLFIGPNRAGVNALNDPNRAALFPYSNIEVLTESSPRNRELFGLFWRDQDNDAFFFGSQPSSNGSSFSDYVNTAGARIDGAIMSGAVDYIAFFADGSIQQGTFFFQADASIQTISVSAPTTLGNPSLRFQISSQRSDSAGPYFVIQVNNGSSQAVQIYLRRRFISVGEAGGVAETIAFITPGKFGFSISGNSGQPVNTSVLDSNVFTAVDSLGLPITYSATNLPGTLVINPSTGQISGNMPDDADGAYLIATIIATSSSGLSTSQNLNITVDAAPTLQPEYFSVLLGQYSHIQGTTTSPPLQAGPYYLPAYLPNYNIPIVGAINFYLIKSGMTEPFACWTYNSETPNQAGSAGGMATSILTFAPTEDVIFNAGDYVTFVATPAYEPGTGWETVNPNAEGQYVTTGETPPDPSLLGYVFNWSFEIPLSTTPTGNGVGITSTPPTTTLQSGLPPDQNIVVPVVNPNSQA